jgi:excisionase family DNA binding protein
MQTNRKLYSVNSAAHALDVSTGKVYNMLKSGDLKSVQVGADRRIPASEIERIATEGTSK